MPRRKAPPDLEPYRAHLKRWMPKAELRPPAEGANGFDAVLAFRVGRDVRRYLVEEKRHLRVQDAGVIADQMRRKRAALPREAGDGLLLLAPHVRAQQAAMLERAGIDYVDLAGNAHLQVPGLLVHVEGRRPDKEPTRAPARPQRAWTKAVMALLIRPDLLNAPYRTIAEHADVALGTVVACVNDLALRGLLLERKNGRELTDRPTLVALWVNAYTEALRPKLKERRLQLRADDKQALVARLTGVLADRGIQWALTGADAAERRTHFFRAEETEIYAPVAAFEDRGLQKVLVAQPATRTGNLLVIEPPGPLALPRLNGDGVPAAPELLAYAELRYRGTEQALEAAELLLPAVLDHAGA